MVSATAPSSPRSHKKIDSTLLLNGQFMDNNGQMQDISPSFWKHQLNTQLQIFEYNSTVKFVQGQELQAEDITLKQIAWEAFYNFLALVYSKTWIEKKQANLQALQSFHKMKTYHQPIAFRQLFSSPEFITKDYLIATYCSTYLHQRPANNTQILSMYSYLLQESEALLVQQQQQLANKSTFALEHFIAVVYQQQALIAAEELANPSPTTTGHTIDFFVVKRSFEKSMQFDTQFAIFFCNASQFLWKYNFIQDALNYIDRAIELDSQDESFYISRGCIRFHQREWRQLTRNDFETAIKLNPNCATAHCNLGTTLELLFEEPAQAIECYITSFKLNPKKQSINLVYIARILYTYAMEWQTSLELLQQCLDYCNVEQEDNSLALQTRNRMFACLEELYLSNYRPQLQQQQLQHHCLSLHQNQFSCEEFFDEHASQL